jgi:hypothetical protein
VLLTPQQSVVDCGRRASVVVCAGGSQDLGVCACRGCMSNNKVDNKQANNPG